MHWAIVGLALDCGGREVARVLNDPQSIDRLLARIDLHEREPLPEGESAVSA